MMPSELEYFDRACEMTWWRERPSCVRTGPVLHGTHYCTGGGRERSGGARTVLPQPKAPGTAQVPPCTLGKSASSTLQEKKEAGEGGSQRRHSEAR